MILKKREASKKRNINTNIRIKIEAIATATEIYKTGRSFNRVNHNNGWDSDYNFYIGRSGYGLIPSYEAEGFI